MLACKICNSPSPRAILYFQKKKSWSFKNFFMCDFVDFCDSSSCLTSSQIYPQSERCLVLRRAPCQLSQKKIMAHRRTRISPRARQVNRTVKQLLHKFVVCMNRVSSNTRKWWTNSSIWEVIMVSINRNLNYLSYKRRVLQHFLILTSLLRPRTGFETWREN